MSDPLNELGQARRKAAQASPKPSLTPIDYLSTQPPPQQQAPPETPKSSRHELICTFKTAYIAGLGFFLAAGTVAVATWITAFVLFAFFMASCGYVASHATPAPTPPVFPWSHP
ncbi:MAG: hypothetical protein ABSB42_23580 [Tepidisphaeraceae bacterium]|jgi:hypothetical protein